MTDETDDVAWLRMQTRRTEGVVINPRYERIADELQQLRAEREGSRMWCGHHVQDADQAGTCFICTKLSLKDARIAALEKKVRGYDESWDISEETARIREERLAALEAERDQAMYGEQDLQNQLDTAHERLEAAQTDSSLWRERYHKEVAQFAPHTHTLTSALEARDRLILAIHRDLLERAEMHGQERVVALGSTLWIRLDEAVDAIRAHHPYKAPTNER